MIAPALFLVGAAVFLVTMTEAIARHLDEEPGSYLRLFAWHHEYVGWGLYVASFLMPWAWLGVVVQVLALVLEWDDTVQHAIQLLTGKLYWRSPLHRLYRDATLRWAWLRKLEQWLDARFGTRPR